jgi:bacterioferritin-associated ferredoxin
MYVCICHGITDRQIRHAVEQGIASLGELQMQLPVGGCCGRCVDTAEALIHEQQQTAPCARSRSVELSAARAAAQLPELVLA